MISFEWFKGTSLKTCARGCISSWNKFTVFELIKLVKLFLIMRYANITEIGDGRETVLRKMACGLSTDSHAILRGTHFLVPHSITAIWKTRIKIQVNSLEKPLVISIYMAVSFYEYIIFLNLCWICQQILVWLVYFDFLRAV